MYFYKGLVAAREEQFLKRPLQHRMQARSDQFAQRIEHEFAFRNARMRDFQIRAVNNIARP